VRKSFMERGNALREYSFGVCAALLAAVLALAGGVGARAQERAAQAVALQGFAQQDCDREGDARAAGAAPVCAGAPTLVAPPRPVTDFALTDHTGLPFGPQRLRGGANLVFFGFTHCPDVCPTTLARLAAVHRALPEDARERLRIVFVTVDPMRDTPVRMAEYLDAFDAPLTGVTGPLGALAPLLRELGVAYAYTAHREAEHAGHAQHGAPAYTVTHSEAVYLVDGAGRFAGVWTTPPEPRAMAPWLAAWLVGPDGSR
jgi:protein SCO1